MIFSMTKNLLEAGIQGNLKHQCIELFLTQDTRHNMHYTTQDQKNKTNGGNKHESKQASKQASKQTNEQTNKQWSNGDNETLLNQSVQNRECVNNWNTGIRAMQLKDIDIISFQSLKRCIDRLDDVFSERPTSFTPEESQRKQNNKKNIRSRQTKNESTQTSS